MKTFDDYYRKEYGDIAKSAKAAKLSVTKYVADMYGKTVAQFKTMMRGNYHAKYCHSFWRRECENKGTECHRCSKNYSLAEWDKMSLKEKRNR